MTQAKVIISEEAWKALSKEAEFKSLNETIEAFSALNSQVGGDHYKKMGEFQPWSVLSHWLTKEELTGYMKGTVISYLARQKENPMQDYHKAMHTMQLFFELMEKK